MKNKAILLVFFSLLVWGGLSSIDAKEVNVILSQRNVRLDDSFNVIFVAAGQVQEPDFSGLHEDFSVVSTQRSMRTSIINGSQSHEICWNLVLMPKHEGKSIIPSIKFGAYSSEPITIEVTKDPSTPQENEDFVLETELTPSDSVYTQSLLIYTIRLYRAAQLAKAALSEPKANDPDTLIEPLGKDREYALDRRGKQYMVFERKYAVSPQHAGELAFSPISFEGTVITGGRTFFDVQTKIKRLSSDEKKIVVKPIPPSFQKSEWLSANEVKIAEQWSSDVNHVNLGESVTWTLTLTANGCLGKLIPDMALNLPADLKHYVDKPEINNHPTADGVIGVKQIKVALIPTKSGEIQLPELVVNWWDLKANEPRQARLPARVMHVFPNSEAGNGEIAMNTPVKDIIVPSDTHEIGDVSVKNQTVGLGGLPLWIWGLIGLNATVLFGLSTVVYVKLCRKGTAHSLNQIKQRMKKACRTDDAKEAEMLLLVWAEHLHPEFKPRNILEIKPNLPDDFKHAIDELYQYLYGQKRNWSGESLWNAFSGYKLYKKGAKTGKKEGKPLLRNLY